MAFNKMYATFLLVSLLTAPSIFAATDVNQECLNEFQEKYAELHHHTSKDKNVDHAQIIQKVMQQIDLKKCMNVSFRVKIDDPADFNSPIDKGPIHHTTPLSNYEESTRQDVSHEKGQQTTANSHDWNQENMYYDELENIDYEQNEKNSNRNSQWTLDDTDGIREKKENFHNRIKETGNPEEVTTSKTYNDNLELENSHFIDQRAQQNINTSGVRKDNVNFDKGKRGYDSSGEINRESNNEDKYTEEKENISTQDKQSKNQWTKDDNSDEIVSDSHKLDKDDMSDYAEYLDINNNYSNEDTNNHQVNSYDELKQHFKPKINIYNNETNENYDNTDVIKKNNIDPNEKITRKISSIELKKETDFGEYNSHSDESSKENYNANKNKEIPDKFIDLDANSGEQTTKNSDHINQTKSIYPYEKNKQIYNLDDNNLLNRNKTIKNGNDFQDVNGYKIRNANTDSVINKDFNDDEKNDKGLIKNKMEKDNLSNDDSIEKQNYDVSRNKKKQSNEDNAEALENYSKREVDSDEIKNVSFNIHKNNENEKYREINKTRNNSEEQNFADVNTEEVRSEDVNDRKIDKSDNFLKDVGDKNAIVGDIKDRNIKSETLKQKEDDSDKSDTLTNVSSGDSEKLTSSDVVGDKGKEDNLDKDTKTPTEVKREKFKDVSETIENSNKLHQTQAIDDKKTENVFSSSMENDDWDMGPENSIINYFMVFTFNIFQVIRGLILGILRGVRFCIEKVRS